MSAADGGARYFQPMAGIEVAGGGRSACMEQWHSEIDPTCGVNLGAFTREQLTQRMTQVGASLSDLTAARPDPATRGRKRRQP